MQSFSNIGHFLKLIMRLDIVKVHGLLLSKLKILTNYKITLLSNESVFSVAISCSSLARAQASAYWEHTSEPLVLGA